MLGPVLHVLIENGTEQLVLPDAGVEGMDELTDHRLGYAHLQTGRFRVRRHCGPPRSPKLYSGYLLFPGCATRLRPQRQVGLAGCRDSAGSKQPLPTAIKNCEVQLRARNAPGRSADRP